MKVARRSVSLQSGTGAGRSSAPAASESAASRSADAERPAIHCDSLSECARAALDGSAYRFVADPRKADLIWLREDYEKWFERLKPFQLLNHLPNWRAVTDKGYLTEHLQRFDRVQSKYDFGLKSLMQETYRLYVPEERARFFAQLPAVDSPENLWILKPCGMSSGVGIQILWRFDVLRDVYAHPEKYDFHTKSMRYVIQRYIRNPLLLDGRKSEMRIYWLIPSVDPLLVLMYGEGTVRLNSKPFVLDDFDNALVHLTNAFQQKSHPEYDPSVVLKWSFADLENDVVRSRKLVPENFIEGRLKPQLKRMLSFVADAAAPSLVLCPPQGLFFGLYGADVILDDTLHPWLTEIQKGPGLSFDDPVKRKVIPPMVNEAVSIVLEVQRRKRKGLSLEHLDAVSGFEWVIPPA